MSKKNPVEKCNYINNNYKDYILSTFKFENNQIQKLLVDSLEKEELFKGPYIDMVLPFKRGKSINDLINNGDLCESFRKLSAIDFDRPLYSHQEEAIRIINSGHSAIITTGTGSGKTECFLYPVINHILKEIENGNTESGIRAIFLFPMNALINDQVERLRDILKDCPDIKYGFYTGDTPEKTKAEDKNLLNNELLSREEIRQNPPHILFTNYSMLEYMLIRPKDEGIFNEDKMNYWKYVVLDEAHTYNGALGIEISMLLRRVTGFAKEKPQFILTSATLGEEGKSENEILEFGKNLTSSELIKEDIIFSKRIDISNDPIVRIDGKDYITLKNNINNLEKVKQIVNKYINSNSNLINELLYDLLVSDKNVHDIRNFLRNGPKLFKDLFEEFRNNYNDIQEIVSLIDIINVASKNGIGIFDLKYHSFVRNIMGAFITIDRNDINMSLSKTNEINGFKAFEIGNCRFCDESYLVGREINKDGLSYLVQNTEVDIYENYGEIKVPELSFYTLKNIEMDDENGIRLEECELCTKCGEIHIKNNLNAKKCNCDNNNRITIYKVLNENSNEKTYNNIMQCPYCGNKHRGGIVRTLDIGIDEGAGVVAQLLYDAIDEGDEKLNDNKVKFSLTNKTNNNIETADKKIKQYLTFSDSRQKASFAAVFFDYNHTRILRKRLIWEVIKDNEYKEMSIEQLASLLDNIIKKYDLFNNELSSTKNAWATILFDLLKVDGNYDGEGLGLYYFELNLREVMKNLNEDDLKSISILEKLNINKEKLYVLLQIVLNLFKITPAINYTISTLSPDEKKDILEYRRFDNYVTLKKQRASNAKEKKYDYIKSFLPVNKDNAIHRYVVKTFNCSSEEANELLTLLFNDILIKSNELIYNGKLLNKNQEGNAYQINVNNYVLKNYKESKYYRCNKCGRLTPFNINNKCVHDRCDGELEEVDLDVITVNNYYRQKYINSKIEKIVIKEHTAQLGKEKAKEYQNDFKNKKINILSCSTTFEMGVDIGDLETVFMRNVPPSPANYVQRAGRAGRRKDSAAFILTFCSSSSHDYNYWSNPENMISGKISPPYFNVLNKKIIIRHLMSSCLGFFFKNNRELFDSINNFIFLNDGKKLFYDYIKNKPKELNNYINNKFLLDDGFDDYKNFKWFELMEEKDDKFDNFVESEIVENEEYEKCLNDYKIKLNNGDKVAYDVQYYGNQIQQLKERNLLEELSKFSVIPKYGFPIDVVDLQIYNDNGKRDRDHDLNRDLKIAISEYAPGSEVIVDGNKYTSQYITTRKDKLFKKNFFQKCNKCKRISLVSDESSHCKYCGETFTDKQMYYIDPIYGFKTGKTKESKNLKPKRTYNGEIIYIGNNDIDNEKYKIGKITIETNSDDELLVMNRSVFYMCSKCGYTEIGNKSVFPKISKKHKQCNLYQCDNEELYRVYLGHSFKTDVIKLNIPLLDMQDNNSMGKALSFLYALLDGASIELNIDRDDIDGIVEPNTITKTFDIILFDNIPGGAGFVKRLTDGVIFKNCLIAALNKISVHCCDEDTSCYNCLRNFNNQRYHNLLKRKFAIETLKEVIKIINP